MVNLSFFFVSLVLCFQNINGFNCRVPEDYVKDDFYGCKVYKNIWTLFNTVFVGTCLVKKDTAFERILYYNTQTKSYVGQVTCDSLYDRSKLRRRAYLALQKCTDTQIALKPDASCSRSGAYVSQNCRISLPPGMRFKFGNTLTTTVTLDISNSRQMCQHVYKSCKYPNQLLPASSCTTDNPSLFYDQCSFGIKSPNAFNVDGKFELQSTWICGQNGIIKTSYKYSAGCPDGFLQTKHLNANKGCERLIANFLFGKCDLSRDNAKFQNPTLPKLLQDTFPYVCNNGQDNSNKLVVVMGCLRYQTPFANALTPDKTCVASKSHFFRKCDFHVAENYRWVNPQNKLLSLITSDCDDDGKRSPEKVLLVKGCPKPTSVTPTGYSLDHKCATTKSLYFRSCLAIAMSRWLFTVNSSFQDEVGIGCDNGKSNVTRLDLIPFCPLPRFASNPGAVLPKDACIRYKNGFVKSCRVDHGIFFRMYEHGSRIDSKLLPCSPTFDPTSLKISFVKSCTYPSVTTAKSIVFENCDDEKQRFFRRCLAVAGKNFFIEQNKKYMRSLWVSCSDDGVPSVTTIMTYKVTQACLYESIDHGKILSGCKMNGPCVFYCDMFYQSRLGTRYGEEDCIFRGFVHQPCCQPAPTLYVVIIVPIVVVLLVFFLTISFFRRILCFRSPKNRNKSSGISTQTVVLTDSKNKTSANTNSNEEEVFEIIV